MKIEIITTEETLRFKKIRLESLKESPDAFGTTFDQASSWDDENWVAQVKNLVTFLASIDGEDVGVVRTVVDKDDPSVAWIISMWTSPKARGKKVGSSLIEAIIEWARGKDLKSIKLDVVDSNAAAIGLYEKYGFQKNGVISRFPEPRDHLTEHQRELKL